MKLLPPKKGERCPVPSSAHLHSQTQKCPIRSKSAFYLSKSDKIPPAEIIYGYCGHFEPPVEPKTRNSTMVIDYNVYIEATGGKGAEMVSDQGAIYATSSGGYNWKAAVQETVSATLNR